MDLDIYEKQIEEKTKKQIEIILEKDELNIEEIRFLMEILSSNKIRKMSNLL